MDKLIREFLEYIELERGHSPLTIRNYEAYLSKFADFAKENGVSSVEKIDLGLIKKWRLTLHRRELANKTLNYYMISIRSFLKYLSKMDIKSLAPEKIELADTPERQINFLEKEEVERILAVYSGSGLLEVRNKAILEVLFSTGTRVSELVNLDIDQVNLQRSEFSVLGKGGKRRVVFLSDSARDALQQYLDKRHDQDKAVFIRVVTVREEDKQKETGRITTRQVERIVKEAAKRAGIVKQVSPHSLRHSFATDILRSGADLRSVQGLLGHASVTTTQVYTHLTDKHLREVHRKYHNQKEGNDHANAH
ncbi:MAG: tyrosine-type recombinase/integrase [Candidatus Berkelbacteria bacterium]|nr:tyrosine-type recombinase/integrase [Candidatus Berkelbacteria bacterium]